MQQACSACVLSKVGSETNRVKYGTTVQQFHPITFCVRAIPTIQTPCKRAAYVVPHFLHFAAAAAADAAAAAAVAAAAWTFTN